MKFTRLLLVPFLLVCFSAFSQNKILQAVKASEAPKIDGDLSDAIWLSAPLANNFIQNFPTFGQAASQNTEVRILYDDNAVYIGAYLYDDPSLIRKQLTARDGEQRQDVDYFSVFLDTYNDDQNGFQFLVTSANVQSDARMGPNLSLDFGEYGDKTWEAVWESKVSIKKDGWVVEMKIPYISLRFAKKDIQNWGINFLRHIRRINETSFWNPVNPQENGFANQFGDYVGIKNLEPPLRLSFSPYISGGGRSTPLESGYQSEFLRNGGMDVKYGLNESFTLDATLIPDFGQVVSDNVINNLSPFEVRFDENRPFFTEGTELFKKAGLFYSRRVGKTPGGFSTVRNFESTNPDWEIKKNPSVTQLYNAIKFSGRSQKKLGIGIFNAITAEMNAKLHNNVTGKDTTIMTEPLANYNIIVLDQALKGRSFITFTNTNVLRRRNERDANVTAFDFAFYNKKNLYALNGTARYSKITGTNGYDGYHTTLRIGKVSGEWQWFAQGDVKSEKYDPNDLGLLFSANQVTYRSGFTYRKFIPTKTFITYSYGLESRLIYLYDPYAYSRTDLIASGFWVFKNFWDINLLAVLNPGKWKDYFELRTPWQPLQFPTNYVFEVEGSTDSRKKLYVSFKGVYAAAPDYDDIYKAYSLGFRYRFSERLTLQLNMEKTNEENQLGYAFQRETNGDPIAGFRNNKQVTSIFSGLFNFTPRMNLTLRARHYWNKVTYNQYLNVDPDGKLIPKTTPPPISSDDNFNIFNIDAFLTWDFRLGSRIILAWKNWLGDTEFVDGTMHKTYLRNLSEVIDLRHGNEVTIRFIYFLDYNQFRKKR